MKFNKNRTFSYAAARWLLTNRVNGTNRRKMKNGEQCILEPAVSDEGLFIENACLHSGMR